MRLLCFKLKFLRRFFSDLNWVDWSQVHRCDDRRQFNLYRLLRLVGVEPIFGHEVGVLLLFALHGEEFHVAGLLVIFVAPK
jgi:hypothetical protein